METDFSLAIVLLVLVQSARIEMSPCIVAPLFSENSTACQLIIMDKVQAQFKNNALKIIPITVEAEFDTVVDFVSRTFSMNQNEHGNVNCSEVIGVVGNLDLKTASIIHTLASRANLSITLVSTFLSTTNLVLPNLFHMNPLSHYVEALAAFFDHQNWTRIGLISDDTDYHEFAAELVQQKLIKNPERRIVPFVRISENDNRTKTIQTFKEYETDVIFISTSDKVACSLIQEARRVGFTWPEYAWILFDARFHPSLETCQEEGVIIFTDQNIFLEGSSNYHVRCNYNEMDKFINSSIFLNSVSLAASNSLSNVSFSGQVKFREGNRLNNISIAQIESSRSREKIAFYNTESQMLSVLSSFSVTGDKPRGTILIVYFQEQYLALRTTLVILLSVFLIAFVTIVFILYIFFRNEPEIKATSVTVSLSMFLGCYVLIAYMLLQVTNTPHCFLLLWVGLGGISLPLIVATLLAKILRVYLIFYDPLSFKKKLFSDPFLFLYILLLVSPNLFILVLWSSYDPFTLNEEMSLQENYVFVYSRCLSEHTIKWLITEVIYFLFLSVTLMCLALKTSKIRYKHFKDTKATNAFIYLCNFVIILALIFWYFFRLREPSTTTLLTTNFILYIGHSSIVMLCQFLLFIPKVYPPLKRRLTRNQVRSK